MRSEFVAGDLWPDEGGRHINAHGGGVLCHEGTYYWFGEHKIEGTAGNRAEVGVHCYSSRDLYNWRDEGIALAVSKAHDSDLASGCVLERPKVIFNAATGRFVMWFHLELQGCGYASARSGVATSPAVTGPYTYETSFRPNAGILPRGMTSPTDGDDTEVFARDFTGGQMARDMTLFVDDDGTAYHIYSSEENRTTQISQLTADYLRPSGRYARLFVGRHMEAHAMCRRHGRYHYLASGCTGWRPNTARAAVADSIWGPWTETGNPCSGPNADLTFGGQSTFILPVAGRPDDCIAMFDLWRPENAIDGRYLWLPINFSADTMRIEYQARWDLSCFGEIQRRA